MTVTDTRAEILQILHVLITQPAVLLSLTSVQLMENKKQNILMYLMVLSKEVAADGRSCPLYFNTKALSMQSL